ncbi:MAG: septal ring lytic transglycosylase RlpA family protein [Deltaproteobacteria bacterium]|uniref:Probable endolytic peptidoglycan transglycosylase RlpA n=1 Tax=Candidatus Zymogenus saltonus TaxID=2844893 RepID=A0A9D8PP12_9DELT|nr:septal ring lytic transglycosylase RlpA family protein [Candidatus Zymogenus saltonus]
MNNFKPFLIWTIIFLFPVSGCSLFNMGVKSRHNTYIPPSEDKVSITTEKIPPAEVVDTFEGMASWYGPKFHGKKTASGEIFDMYELTAAHKSLPMGTKCIVTNLENNKSVTVRINDRGPFAKERVIDLSYASAKVIDMIHSGTIKVRVEVLAGEATEELETATAPESTTDDTPKLNNTGEYKVYFTIQVGSFSSRENAERLSETIKGYIENVWIEEFVTTESTYYRVRAGKFPTKEDAEKGAEVLSEAGHSGFITEIK